MNAKPGAVLLPAENLALTVARAQIERGENPPVNTTAMLVAALDRLTGRADESDPVADIDEAFAKLEVLQDAYRRNFGPIPSPAERLHRGHDLRSEPDHRADEA